MTRTDDARLADWLASGSDQAPTGGLAAALAAARRQRQRPGWLARLSGSTIAATPGELVVRYVTLGFAGLVAVSLLVGVLVAGAMVVGALTSMRPDRQVPALDATATPTPSIGRSVVPSAVPSEVPAARLVAYTVTSCPEVIEPFQGCIGHAWLAAGDGSAAHPLFPEDEQNTDLLGWSGDGSRLLVARGGDLVLTDAAGSQLGSFPTFYSCKVEPCTDGAAYLCAFPCTGVDGFALSPDGTRVAFVRTYSNDDDATVVAVLDTATGQVTQLPATRATNGSERCWEDPSCQGSDDTPRWAPDGSRIAFARQVMSPEPGVTWTSAAVYVIDADGSNLRRVSPIGMYAFDPHWSPDGTRLAFTNTEFVVNADHSSVVAQNVDLYTIDVDGSGLTRLTDDGFSARADWTVDGRLAFMRQVGADDTSGHEAWIMDADGRNSAALGTSLAELTAAGCQTCLYPVDVPAAALPSFAFWQPDRR